MALADTIRKVPTWGWLIVGGTVLGVGYAAYRDRRTPDIADVPAGEESLSPLSEYDLSSQPSPAGVVYPGAPPADSGETVGAIGVASLEAITAGFTGVFEGLPALVESLRPDPVVPIGSVPEMPQPQPPPAPSPAPVPSQPHTNGSGGVSVLGRRFAGSYRSQEVPTPNLASRDFNIFWHKPHPDQRWRTWTTGGTRHWRKISEGNFGG